jgi:hypothetical protein
MNITTLVIDGNEYGIRFGMYSARYLADKLTSSFCFVGDEITEIGISHVVYAGYLNHCAVKDEKPLLTFEDVVNFVEASISDTDRVKQLTDITALWVQCQFKEKEQKQPEPEAETKKKTSRKSKSSPMKSA